MDGKKKKQLSGAQKRKKKREKEEAVKEAVADMERLKLGPTKLWTGLVLHHKDVFVCVFSYINGLILEILKNKYTRNTREDDNEREI